MGIRAGCARPGALVGRRKKRAAPHFRELLETAPDAMNVFDRSGRILEANSPAETLFGYAPGELLGQPSAVLIPLRFRERHEGHQARFFAHPSKRPMGKVAGKSLQNRATVRQEMRRRIAPNAVEYS